MMSFFTTLPQYKFRKSAKNVYEKVKISNKFVKKVRELDQKVHKVDEKTIDDDMVSLNIVNSQK